MSKRLEFVGHTESLADVMSLVQTSGSRHVICVDGPGGIGKTRFLQEVQRLCGDDAGVRDGEILVTDIVDFDERALKIARSFGRRVAHQLSAEAFDAYFEKSLDAFRRQRENVRPQDQEQDRREALNAFIACFNTFTADQRVVLLIDTTEKIPEPNPLNGFEDVSVYLNELIVQARNTVFILAGRDAARRAAALAPKLGEDVILIRLQPLSYTESKEYVNRKTQQLNIRPDWALTEKLVWLSQGKPLLLDLAVEALSRGLSRQSLWLREMDPQQLSMLSDEDRAEKLQAFEGQLVQHITQIRSDMERLLLMMARVYPLRTEMMMDLLKVPPATADMLFERAQAYVFVKPLPDDQISLHDEMRRMVRDYVWPDVDPSGDRRREESRLAAGYLSRRLADVARQITELESQINDAHRRQDAEAELRLVMAQEVLEETFIPLYQQLLFHTMFVDKAEGLEVFITYFEQSTQIYRFQFREALLAEIDKYRDDLEAEQVNAVKIRRVKFLLDRRAYREGCELATELLAAPALSPVERIDALIQRANFRVRLGDRAGGVADLDAAVKLSEAEELPQWLVRALNGRGWAYRNQGDYDEALADYHRAYALSIHLQDVRRTAYTLNNMAHIHAILGNRDTAINSAQEALSIWREEGFGRGMGITYANLGDIYRHFGEIDKAIEANALAYRIFVDEEDLEWMSNVRCAQASILRLHDEFDVAEEYLNWAEENGAPSLRPRILYERAKVAMGRGDLEAARSYFKQCNELSLETNDGTHDHRSFAELLDLAWHFGEYERWRAFLDTHQTHYADRTDKESLRLQGSCLRKIGDLAICCSESNEDGACLGPVYDAALDAYAQGFMLICEHEVHPSYRLGAQVAWSVERIEKCTDPARRARLGRDLAALWEREAQLSWEHPTAMLTFNRWARGGHS